MPTTTVVKWGNSIGVRIPMALIREAHLTVGEVLKVSMNKQGGVVLTPIANTQTGWTEAFNRYADQQDDALMDQSNAFDQDEWTW